jgi:DNA-binding MarR family transcriptional regulator
MKRANPARTVQVWEGLARVHSSMSAAIEKDLLPRAGIPLTWYEVLEHLSRAPGEMLRFQDLARVAGITDSGVSRRVAEMTKAGLIDRHLCPTDRRGVYAHLTDKGKAAHHKARGVVVRSLQRNLGNHLEPAEADAMHATLSRLGA